MVRWRGLACLLSVMLFVGCGGEDKATVSNNEDADLKAPTAEKKDGKSDSVAESAKPDGTKNLPVDLKKIKAQISMPKRTTLAGRWIFGGLQILPPQQKNQSPNYGETSEMILTIQLNESDPDASVISVTAVRDSNVKRTLKLISAKDNHLAFECMDAASKNKAFDFAGQLINGHVIGALKLPTGEVLSLRLTPTEERTFARVPEFRPFEEQQQFIALAQSAVPEEDIKDLIKDHPTSPMLKIAFTGIIEQMMQRNASEEELSKFMDLMKESLKHWGLQARAALMMDVSSRLILTNYDTEQIGKWVEATVADAEAADLKTEVIQRRITNLRDVVKLRHAIQSMEAKTPEKRDEGRAIAAELLKKNPFQTGLVWKLAEAAREDKRTDEALKWFAELAVFPLQEALLKGQWGRDRSGIQNVPPSERVAQLWKEKSGGSEGLDAYLEKVYRDGLLSFAAEPVTKRPTEDSNRVVLLELFTGVRCEQCVCSDVALAGIEKTFPQSMVVALRYHQHIPGQDPLATEEGEARLYNFYRGQGTPTVELNGRDVLQTGGLLIRMHEVYPTIKQAVETELAKPTSIKIELAAKREGDVISIKADASGEGLADGNKRLRVVLTESQIDFKAPNGIRRHDMVVRQIVSGEDGVSIADGKLTYDGQTNVAKVKAAQGAYLEQFAKNQRVEFPVKPLDFKHLSIVAWVQDEQTREVFQTAVVPVE